ncbi:MAG TPA: hypothetical protein VL307_18600, partial [Chitinophagaceae bacterium]|nr:hypothetical protein [Chitinophagaceae bacterium]
WGSGRSISTLFLFQSPSTTPLLAQLALCEKKIKSKKSFAPFVSRGGTAKQRAQHFFSFSSLFS